MIHKMLLVTILLALAAILLTSVNFGCASLDATNDNPGTTPKQRLTAAMYRQAAHDRIASDAFRVAHAESSAAACAAIGVAAAMSDNNRVKIDAARAAMESDSVVASADWGDVIDIVFVGLGTVQAWTDAENDAKAALRQGITQAELDARYEEASALYDKALEMIANARSNCDDG